MCIFKRSLLGVPPGDADRSKACSKRRATAVPNSNEFGLAVARRWHGSGLKRRIYYSLAKFKRQNKPSIQRNSMQIMQNTLN